MTLFKKYNSIENAYQQKMVDTIVNYGYDNGDWVVLEKAHGANICIIVDKDTIQYGKRTLILSPAEARDFYNSWEPFNKYTAAARKVWELLGHPGPIILYGELIGGNYKGVERPTTTTIIVQKGVQYCSHNELYMLIMTSVLSARKARTHCLLKQATEERLDAPF